MEIDFSTSKAEWNGFVEANNGTVFHLYEWPEILNRTYGYKPVYFCARENGEIRGVLPAVITRRPFGRRLISLPFADYCGPLPAGETGTELLKFALEYCRERGLAIEVYSLTESPILKAHHFFDTFLLDTTRPFESVWSQSFSKKVRNSVRKASKMGVVVQRETGEDFLKEYYEVYLETMRRLSSMPHHYSLFNNLRLFLGEKFEMYSARYNGQLIAGLLAFTFNNRTHIWGNASRREYLHLAPNNALYCEVIRRACERGIFSVDLGSSLPETSHYHFKIVWGGVPTPIYLLSNREVKLSEKKIFFIGLIPAKILGVSSKWLFRHAF